jgi:hypothetical protein
MAGRLRRFRAPSVGLGLGLGDEVARANQQDGGDRADEREDRPHEEDLVEARDEARARHPGDSRARLRRHVRDRLLGLTVRDRRHDRVRVTQMRGMQP